MPNMKFQMFMAWRKYPQNKLWIIWIYSNLDQEKMTNLDGGTWKEFDK